MDSGAAQPAPSPGDGRARGKSYNAPERLAPLVRRQSSMHRELARSQVVVCVRVRPLNAQESKEAGSDVCVHKTGPSTLSCENRAFTVDAVLDETASQQAVYELTAKTVLAKVMEGYNGCIFAYGQTGSGKTFSMIGGDGDSGVHLAGVIPRCCRALFARARADAGRTYLIKATFIEVYQEKLRDLLSGTESSRLEIRHDKAVGGRGIYVTGVRERLCGSVDDVMRLLAEGTARRVEGTTNMNAHSSRSHAVMSLKISSQDADDNEGFSRTVSKLNLIDLAGSERAKATGATGARLKEGASINASLSALGNVVNALTSSSSSQWGGRVRQHIPYRDSKLTRLLQDSLGGNAFTSMLCNVSPAKVNAAETASSLRFAERTKKIENRATVNRDPKLALIAELTDQNGKLRGEVKRLRQKITEVEGMLSAAHSSLAASKWSAGQRGGRSSSAVTPAVVEEQLRAQLAAAEGTLAGATALLKAGKSPARRSSSAVAPAAARAANDTKESTTTTAAGGGGCCVIS